MDGFRQHGLPATYGKDYLVLLVEDPFNVFTYWEITPRRQDLARSYLRPGQGEARLAIRLLAHDAGGYHTVTMHPAPAVGQEYFSGLEPGQTYEAELGLADDRGGFLVLLRSNPAMTPALAPASPVTPELPATLSIAIPISLGQRS